MAEKTLSCPILTPNLDQFNDPIEYLSSDEVARLGEQYGIVKIVPPLNWKPPFSLSSQFKFHTRKQRLSDLGIMTRSRNFFTESINRYLKMKKKRPLTAFIMIHGQKVYYYDLYVEVEKQRDTKNIDWDAINQVFNIPPGSCQLKREYFTHIKAYADFLNSQTIPNIMEPSHGHDDQPSDNDDFDSDDDDTTSQDESCKICGSNESPESTLLCDHCDDAYHAECMQLDYIPSGSWFCNRCLIGTGEYGFEEEPERRYSVDDFYQHCADFEKQLLDEHGPLTLKDIETKFWQFIELQKSDLEVRYGADIHNLIPGQISGFPMHESPQVIKDYFNPEVFNYYASQPFNLNNLPFSKGSLLNYINHSISGMTIPWIYVGSLLSTFCWHVEDHYTLSANYCHFGATKKWYGIPSSAADKFESFMKNSAPDLFKKQPDLLHQLVTLVSPDQLIDHGIPVYYADQNPNEFIITYPRVYHAGFNAGFNFNEAVNFTSSNWIEFGERAINDYKLIKKENVFNHYKLLENILINYTNGMESNIKLVKKCLERYKIFAEEMQSLIKHLKTKLKTEYKGKLIDYREYIKQRERFHENQDLEDDEELCDLCKTHIYHGYVEIDNHNHDFMKPQAVPPKLSSETSTTATASASATLSTGGLLTPEASPYVELKPTFKKESEESTGRILRTKVIKASEALEKLTNDDKHKIKSEIKVRRSKRIEKLEKIEKHHHGSKPTRSTAIKTPLMAVVSNGSSINHQLTLNDLNENIKINICLACSKNSNITNGTVIVNVSPDTMLQFIAMVELYLNASK